MELRAIRSTGMILQSRVRQIVASFVLDLRIIARNGLPSNPANGEKAIAASRTRLWLASEPASGRLATVPRWWAACRVRGHKLVSHAEQVP